MKKLIYVILPMTLAIQANAEFVTAPEGLNIREKPSIKSEVVDILPFGTEGHGQSGRGWMKIDGGYIKTDYLSEENPLDDLEYMGEWRITAYAYTGSPCANGNFPEVGYTAACNALPFGTQVLIDGVGVRTVEDTDGGVMGNEWIDLYLGSVDECIRWGDQTRKVWVMK